jgi:Asp-tRNA(Asn)/Glu-tRNA(Gln) amidotransferase C subunit
MSISQDELKNIAEKLSKIPGDNDALLGNITDIIGYMDLLAEVDNRCYSYCFSSR